MALTDLFVPTLSNCREIANAGSTLYVAPINNCLEEPIVYALEADTAVAALATTASINLLTPASTIYLRKGARLTFTAGFVIVAADTVITTATSPVVVPIEPATSAIAINATAFSWGALTLLSPTNIPIDNSSQMVNRTDLSNGLQGSETKTKVMMTSQVELITRPDDRAFWQYVFPAAQSDIDIYALIVRGVDQRHAFGRAKVSNLNDGGQIEEINRVTLTLNFQASFAAPTLFDYLTTVEQTEINLVRTYAGLAPLV